MEVSLKPLTPKCCFLCGESGPGGLVHVEPMAPAILSSCPARDLHDDHLTVGADT